MRVLNIQRLKQFMLIIVLALIVLIFSIAGGDRFLSVSTFTTIVRQVAIIGIVAVGVTFIYIIRGIDLSTGSSVAFVGCVCAMMMRAGFNPYLAVLAAMLCSVLNSIVTGSLVSFLKMAPFIVTLGMMSVLRGAAYLMTGGLPVYGLEESFSFLANGLVFDFLPVPAIIMIVCFLVGGFILNKTTFGRQVYALGGNEEATRLAGCNNHKIRLMCFIFSGLMVAIGGIIQMYRLNSGQPSTSVDLNMDVISAISLGGVSASGGEGKISGVLVGVLIIGTINCGLVVLGFSTYSQQVVRGAILIIALAIDKISNRERVKKIKVPVEAKQ